MLIYEYIVPVVVLFSLVYYIMYIAVYKSILPSSMFTVLKNYDVVVDTLYIIMIMMSSIVLLFTCLMHSVSATCFSPKMYIIRFAEVHFTLHMK
jgi:hypothetical protein